MNKVRLQHFEQLLIATLIVLNRNAISEILSAVKVMILGVLTSTNDKYIRMQVAPKFSLFLCAIKLSHLNTRTPINIHLTIYNGGSSYTFTTYDTSKCLCWIWLIKIKSTNTKKYTISSIKKLKNYIAYC